MKIKKGSVFIIAGLALILAAGILASYNLYDAKRAEKTALLAAEELSRYLEEKQKQIEGYSKYEDVDFIPDYVLYPDMEMPTTEINGYKYIGVLEIPSLELTLPVLDTWSDFLLKISPCRYEGSAYTGSFIIAAHNYTSHFSNLKHLAPGDRIVFKDVAGNTFYYDVVVQESLEPTDVEEMKGGDWELTLFTCTPGGQYRVTVRCEKTEGIPKE
ncbi:MAG: sortase [Clostridia bacterium]|nr:sortase [Clostridia bacterium]